jgi:predicted O-methyltransferase YrrM
VKTINEIWDIGSKHGAQQKTSEFLPFLEFVRSRKPKIIMEIGACYGGTTMCFAQISDTVIAIDVPVNADLPPIEELKKTCDFHYVVGDSHDETTLEQVKKILGNNKLDLLFIDGDHTAEGSRQDFDMYNSLVKTGGIIAFHDIVDSDYHRAARTMVASVYNELAKQYDHVEFLEPNGIDCGIGVLKIRDN